MIRFVASIAVGVLVWTIAQSISDSFFSGWLAYAVWNRLDDIIDPVTK